MACSSLVIGKLGLNISSLSVGGFPARELFEQRNEVGRCRLVQKRKLYLGHGQRLTII